jgi:hypothetical protein
MCMPVYEYKWSGAVISSRCPSPSYRCRHAGGEGVPSGCRQQTKGGGVVYCLLSDGVGSHGTHRMGRVLLWWTVTFNSSFNSPSSGFVTILLNTRTTGRYAPLRSSVRMGLWPNLNSRASRSLQQTHTGLRYIPRCAGIYISFLGPNYLGPNLFGDEFFGGRIVFNSKSVTSGRTDGRTDGRKDGRTDGRTELWQATIIYKDSIYVFIMT